MGVRMCAWVHANVSGHADVRGWIQHCMQPSVVYADVQCVDGKMGADQ